MSANEPKKPGDAAPEASSDEKPAQGRQKLRRVEHHHPGKASAEGSTPETTEATPEQTKSAGEGLKAAPSDDRPGSGAGLENARRLDHHQPGGASAGGSMAEGNADTGYAGKGSKLAPGSASSSDDRLDAVKEQLNDVVQHLAENAALMREHTRATQDQTKQQELQFALQHVSELTAFTYYSEESTYNSSQTKLIKNILWSFLRGSGFLLPNKATLEDPYFCRGNVQAMEVLEVRFREKVLNDLSSILRSRPQVNQENGRYRLSYD